MVKSVFECSRKRFSKSATRENFKPKMYPTDEKTMSIIDASTSTEVIRRRKVEYQFFDLSLNNKSAPGQGHRCISKGSVFFLSSRAKAHFRQAQGHQSANAILGSINTVQNATVVVNGVEHQKTISKKLKNGLVGLQKYSRRLFITFFSRGRLEGANKQRVRLHCSAKAYQSTL